MTESMVVRSRFRAFLVPLSLYAVAALVIGYFITQANQGDRGLDAKRALKAQIFEQETELKQLRTTRTDWERRISLLQSNEIDRDLLDEFAREELGRVNKSDVVILMGPDGATQQ